MLNITCASSKMDTSCWLTFHVAQEEKNNFLLLILSWGINIFKGTRLSGTLSIYFIPCTVNWKKCICLQNIDVGYYLYLVRKKRNFSLLTVYGRNNHIFEISKGNWQETATLWTKGLLKDVSKNSRINNEQLGSPNLRRRRIDVRHIRVLGLGPSQPVIHPFLKESTSCFQYCV